MVLSVGVDVSENRGLDVVVLDNKRRLVEIPESRVSPDGLRAIIESLKPDVDVVAIDSPPGIGIAGASRECELALRLRGVNIFSTPSDATRFARPFYNWIRVGHKAFTAAEAAGFPLFTSENTIRGCSIEVFPHATDVFLRGCLPPAGVTRRVSRKRNWRSETLRLAGVEETDRLTSLDAVDAALAALTGLHAIEGAVEAIGDPPFWIIAPRSAVQIFSLAK
jgi:predicted nuclease with RNAse H fold